MIFKFFTAKKIAISLALITIMVAVFFAIHNVEIDVTKQDIEYINKIMAENGSESIKTPDIKNFEDQIGVILSVQKAALKTPEKNGVIPLGTPREPKNLYEAERAYCGDRSRFMHKALRSFGFDVRYVTIMINLPDETMLEVLLSKGGDDVRSHALIEVLTQKGWLVIDSRRQWISLTEENTPIALKDIQEYGLDQYSWNDKSGEAPWFLLGQDFYIFYGLYSRHGKFYAPYTPYVPDINWSEFIQNF